MNAPDVRNGSVAERLLLVAGAAGAQRLERMDCGLRGS
jgi:hypothetical protein